MAVTATWYGYGLAHLADADLDWLADTVKVSLHTATYSPNEDTDDYHDDATNEISGTGYTAGGATLGSKTVTVSAGSNEMQLDAADTAWTTATFTARYAVIYKDRGGAASADEVFGYVDFGGDEQVSSGTFTIQWDASGVLKISY